MNAHGLTWVAKPANASMARRPFFSSFTFRVARSPLDQPKGSKMPPG